jgi:hypothetical protein
MLPQQIKHAYRELRIASFNFGRGNSEDFEEIRAVVGAEERKVVGFR